MQVEQRVSQRAREFAKKFVGCDCRICVEKRVSILMEFEQTAPSVLAESTSNDCLLVAEAVRERCAGVAEKLVRFDRKNGDEQQRARADAFQAGQRHAAQEIRGFDLSGVGVG